MLPLELEREIFSLASTESTQIACSFLLVSRTVHYWIEKFLYRTIVLPNENVATRFLSSVYSRPHPHNFARQAVKSVCLKGDICVSTSAEIISLCSGTLNLALWIGPSDLDKKTNPLLEPLDRLALTSLSLSLSLLFSHTPSISLFTLQVFHSLTHLEILNRWVLWNSTVGLEHLHGLTHLCLHIHTRRTKPGLIVPLLSHPCIRVLVFRISEGVNAVQAFLESNLLSDFRIVLLSQDLASQGDVGREDISSFWTGAEKIVDRRRVDQGGSFNVQDPTAP
ncbi:hypothetical protein BD769DRAFT_1672620 [Suillus cothurnatus]|nr:hypothetical protein BD769DRAFT_1672620 [Suillus cothurnatus]